MNLSILLLFSICGLVYLCEGGRVRRPQKSNQNRNVTRAEQRKQAEVSEGIKPKSLKKIEKRIPIQDTTNYSKSEWDSIQKQVTNFTIDYEPVGNETITIRAAVVRTPTISRHIVGGSTANPGQFPYMANIIIMESSLCGGSCIHSRFILTAGHCTYGFNKFTVNLGTYNRAISETGRVVQTTTTKIVHPSYNTKTLANDIALLKLNKDIVFSDHIRPIRLPPKSDATKSFEGLQGVVCGFGLEKDDGAASNVLKYVAMNIISNTDCVKSYGSYIRSSNICLEMKKDGTAESTCNGDSGGPMSTLENDGIRTQQGVVSFGSSEGCNKAPSSFTRVSSYLGWISGNTGLAIRS